MPPITDPVARPARPAEPARTPALALRGEGCSRDRACADPLTCLPGPGGYCASECGLAGSACDAACVETPRGGELCLARCASDRDCRAGEGYLCDPAWKACVIPNFTAIVPRACREPAGIARDPAFAPSEALSTAAAPGLYQFEPAAVVADDGGLVALYGTRGAVHDGNVLGIARIDALGRTAIDGRFEATRTNHFDPRLARDAKGTLYAAWLRYDARDTGQEIALARSRDRGATWSQAIAVHEPGDCPDHTAACVDQPMLAIGPDPVRRGGQIVYVMYAAGGLRVRASRDGGATFGPARTALSGSYGNAVVGGDGRLHVVTLDGGPLGAFGSADHRIEYTWSANGGATFARPVTLSIRDEMLPFYFSNPGVAVDDRRGWLYAVYTRGGRDGRWDLAILATKDKGKTWARTRIGDDPACAIHMVPNLAVDPTTGQLHIAWYDSRGNRYAHAVCAPGGARCTQVGRINDVPFAALSTERHGAKWLGAYQSLVVDDKRRVLHAVWTQPVAEGDKIISRIFHARAKLPAR